MKNTAILLIDCPDRKGLVAGIANFLESFKDFPPSQRPASFSIDQIMQKLQEGAGSK